MEDGVDIFGPDKRVPIGRDLGYISWFSNGRKHMTMTITKSGGTSPPKPPKPRPNTNRPKPSK